MRAIDTSRSYSLPHQELSPWFPQEEVVNYDFLVNQKPAREIRPLNPEVTSRQEAMEYFLEEGEKFIRGISQRNEPTRRELNEIKNSFSFDYPKIVRRINKRLMDSEQIY